MSTLSWKSIYLHHSIFVIRVLNSLDSMLYSLAEELLDESRDRWRAAGKLEELQPLPNREGLHSSSAPQKWQRQGEEHWHGQEQEQEQEQGQEQGQEQEQPDRGRDLSYFPPSLFV
jgi:hypothetical protein